MTINKILIALDGSRRAEEALRWARLLSPRAEYVLLQAIEPGLTELGADVLRAERYLASMAREFPPGTRTMAIVGPPSAVILDAAEEAGADLVAVTTFGLSKPSPFHLGRVTEKLIHGSVVPLLIVPTSSDLKVPSRIRRVLVTLDGSEPSESVLRPAKRLAIDSEAEMILAHIASPGKDKTKIENYLADKVSELRREVFSVRSALVDGALPDSILTLAEVEHADLIAMSGHGYGAVKRWLLGSVAGRLVRTSPIPIFLTWRDPAK
jgi:nucleotide-binding universal stress UspA family protein